MNCLTANSISTSRGNPIAMATGNAVLDFIDSHELQANAVEVGRFLFDGLREPPPTSTATAPTKPTTTPVAALGLPGCDHTAT